MVPVEPQVMLATCLPAKVYVVVVFAAGVALAVADGGVVLVVNSTEPISIEPVLILVERLLLLKSLLTVAKGNPLP